MNFKKLFLNHCSTKGLEINDNQIRVLDHINKFYNINFSSNLLLNFFFKKNVKLGFYLHGDVGVGKTMILNFFYDNFGKSKKRLHFNEFMVNFHNFVFQNKDNKQENIIDKFVNNLKKKYKLIYFDELQVTNIVDAMILGNLFKRIFDEKIKVIFTSNIKINDLYKDGLQRDQFLKFIKIMKNMCYEEELIIGEDYRESKNNENENYFFPLTKLTKFKINKLFRKLTKNKSHTEKILFVKGRKFIIKEYYEGIVRFDFTELCNENVGAEDYIKITEASKYMVIENLPNFNDMNSNQQQRFITLIDIIYEKKLPLVISSENDIKYLTSAKNLIEPFKRTSSRLYELTSKRS